VSLIHVDAQKCKRDGLCVAVCPNLLLELKEGSPIPTPIENAEEQCNDCGHCVVICPQGALAQRAMSPEQCEPLQASSLPSAAQLEHLMRGRRSIRTFKKEPLPREVLAKLIEVARYAPTGSNLQHVRWLVVYDEAEVRRLARLTEDWLRHKVAAQPDNAVLARNGKVLARAVEQGYDLTGRGAPHVVIAYGLRGRETNGIIALTFLELAAFAQGLGACWAGWLSNAAREWAPVQEALGLPEGYTCAGAMMIGSPKYKYQRLPQRNEAQIAWR